MAFKRFNGIPHPHLYAALVPVESFSDLPGFDLLMPQKEFTVGRAEHNDIVIRGAHISDEHCKLVWNAEKKQMFVEWLPTTNGTWIMNERYECHRLKKGESYPFIRGDISFAPSVQRYGKQSGPDDYLYSLHVYPEHEMEEQLEPEELAERKKARARFKTARFDKATAVRKCVVSYRSSSDRPPDASLPRQATPPSVLPPRLGKDFRATGNVGHYEPRDRPDGHDRTDPDIVWRGYVPIKPGTKPNTPGEIELWSHHYGLPVGLHPKYQRYSGVPYDDTFTELDRERLERRMRLVNYIGSAEQKAAYKAECEAEGRIYFTPTPSPSPVPESNFEGSPAPGELQPATSPPAIELPSTNSPPSRARTPERDQLQRAIPEHAPDLVQSFCSPRRSLSIESHKDGSGVIADQSETQPLVGLRKRNREDSPTGDEPAAKRRSLDATSRAVNTTSHSALVQPSEKSTSLSAARPVRGQRTSEPGLVLSMPPRRSARLVGKPAVQYKY